MKKEKVTNKVVLREAASIPLLLVLYGIPVVLTVLVIILVGLVVRWGIQKYQELQEKKKSESAEEEVIKEESEEENFTEEELAEENFTEEELKEKAAEEAVEEKTAEEETTEKEQEEQF